jgi:hypothetical protein
MFRGNSRRGEYPGQTKRRAASEATGGAVRPTLDVTIRETVAHLRRKKRPDLGIALISI